MSHAMNRVTLKWSGRLRGKGGHVVTSAGILDIYGLGHPRRLDFLMDTYDCALGDTREKRQETSQTRREGSRSNLTNWHRLGLSIIPIVHANHVHDCAQSISDSYARLRPPKANKSITYSVSRTYLSIDPAECREESF